MIVRTETRKQINNLDELPIWDRGLIDYKKYHQFVGQSGIRYEMTIQGTRGCPFRCFYCDVQHMTPFHRRRSVNNILEEVKYLYSIGVRNIEFIDDAFNVKIDDFKEFFREIVKSKMNINFYFQSGLRGDMLDGEAIDLMVAGGTKSVNLSLESASPRLQKLMRKNLKIDKLYTNIQYIVSNYPYLILGLNAMHGFPTETEEEAQSTIDFIKSIKWLHFVQLHNVRIFPGSLLEQIALENGVTKEQIEESLTMPYHLIPTTIQLDKEFSRRLRLEFNRNYVFNKERMKYVLDKQICVMNEQELIYKYKTIFPTQINTLDDILRICRLRREDIDFSKMKKQELCKIIYPTQPKEKKKIIENENECIKILFLDVSHFFTKDIGVEIRAVEPPLGQMAIATYLHERFGNQVECKIMKSGVDYDSFEELHSIIKQFHPNILGLRTMTYYKHFFEQTVDEIRKWGYDIPIVAGGPHPTISPEECFEKSDIQVVSFGEGEYTWGDLVEVYIQERKWPDNDKLANIQGIAYMG